jgi:metal-responsive CopG/Arc/MetJ family transcriptional regulator
VERALMQKKGQKMTRITITVPENLLKNFRTYCDRQYRPLSTQLQFMMSEAVENQKKGKDDEDKANDF